jgi:hypothetical protein
LLSFSSHLLATKINGTIKKKKKKKKTTKKC